MSDAGTATGTYIFDISDVERKAAQLRQIFAGIRNDAARATTLAGPAAAPLARGGGAAGSADADAAAFTRLQRAQASLEQQQARNARQQGDSATAAQLEAQAQERLTSELNAQNGVTVQSIAIERQLASVQQQAARGAQAEAAAQQQAMNAMRASVAPVQQLGAVTQQNANITQEFGSAAKSSFLSIAGPAALVAIAFRGIGAAIEGAGEALELRETKNSLRAVAGDTQTYAQVIRTAREEQVLFGGTLQDNIEGLQGLAITARSSGAQLTTLIDLQKRLAILDPAQGAGGARIALNEALSGDPTSLAKRYEIPRLALAKLRDTSIPVEERLKVIDGFLNKVGITSESVAGKVDQDAVAFRRLGQELGDAKLNAGSELATAFSGTATGLARVVGLINQNPQAIAELKALLGGGRQVTQSGIDDAAKQVAEAQAKFSLARGQSQGRAEANIGGAAQYKEAIDLLTQLKLSGNDTGDALTRQYQQNTLSGDEYLQKLREISTADAARAAGTDATSIAQNAARETAVRVGGAFDDERRAAAQLQLQTGQAASDIQRSAEASTLDAAAKELQSAKTKLVTDQNRLTTDSFLALNPNMDASGAIAAAAAQGYPPLIGQLAALRIQLQGATNDQIALNNAENAKGVAKTVAVDRFAGRSGGRGDSSDAAADAAASVGATKAQTAQTERQIDAQIALASAQGNTAKQIDLLRQKGKLFGKDEVDRQQIEAQIISLQKSAGKVRVDAAATTGLQLAQTEENSQLAILKAQREGQERLRDQEQDYQLSRTRKQEDFEKDYRKLLAQGQRARAADLKAEFELSQRRAAEDFNIQRQRTNRNSAESTGDIDARTDLRQSQIGDRAALRGVRPGANGAPPTLPPPPHGVPDLPPRPTQPIVVRVTVAPTAVQIDGKTFVELIWPTLEPKIDDELAASLAGVPPPGGGQTGVAGSRP